MKITVIGTGYVGLIAGLGFAEFGNDVICLDLDETKIQRLNQGICPIYEPDAEIYLRRNMAAKRIRFTTDTTTAVRHGELIFIGVGTPPDAQGTADLQYVYQAAQSIGQAIERYTVVVDKSTVPIGTAREVHRVIQQEVDARGVQVSFDVASNPEFLREGRAIGDFTNPDRVVLGVESPRAEELLQKAYRPIVRNRKPIMITTIETAEMIKYASNAFLATKITFINEIANLCEKVGANVLEVATAMGKDGRISPKFLHAGPGYGGSCFPKDTMAIAAIGRQMGTPLTIVESVIVANERQKEIAAQKIAKRFPDGAIVSILGLSFKPETDDIRQSPALTIMQYLSELSEFRFQVYDPQAMTEARKALGNLDNIQWCDNLLEACSGVDCVAVVTEWYEFRSIDFHQLLTMLKQPIIFDYRNIYDRQELESMGFEVYNTGVMR